MNAKQVMTEDPVTLLPNAKLRDALEILQTLEIRHLPVVTPDNVLVGMISDRDIRQISLPYTLPDPERRPGASVLDTPITDLMNSNPITAGPEAGLRELVDLMLEHRIGALPVVEEGSSDLLGIVSYVDLLRALRDELEID
ncbi:MAG: CBS domain-containing protein [Deltaproteobacteria bacterium]|nr:CBS domain-containing protein [Deltaproteobacteria bacterium]